jgi:flagellar biosynthesis/type III secretory pathway chaperone
MTREDDLNELAQDISTAIEKARQLNLRTSAYILSMVLVEISEALKVDEDEEQEADDAAG